MIIRIPERERTHTGLFASSGGGKGTGFIMPFMLSHRGSVVVLDAQGVIHDETAEHRRKKFGHRIIRLDSSEICGPGGDSLNPVQFIEAKAKNCLDQCNDLGNLMVVRTGHEPDPTWNDNAQNVIKVFTYYTVQCEPDLANRNLLAVRNIVSNKDAYMACLNMMRQRGGKLKQQADSLKWLDDEELNSVLTSVNRHTQFMDSEAVSDALRQSTFSPLDLHDDRTTIYVIESAANLETHAAQLRLYFGTILNVLSRGKASEKHKVTFVIDEAAALGRMKPLESAVTTMRGYGIRLLLVYQSPSQLQEVYGEKAKVVMDNLNTQIFMAMRSSESHELISKTIGDTTVGTVTGSEQTGWSHPTSGSTQPTPGSASGSSTVNYAEVSRRVVTTSEVRTAPDKLAWVMHKNLPVITAKRLDYYDSPVFKKTIFGRRTGENRGLGLAGFITAAICLTLSFLFSTAVGRWLRHVEAQRRQTPANIRFDGNRGHAVQPYRYRHR